MGDINQVLFDPFAPTEDQVQDAFDKGFISRNDGDKLIFAASYIDENLEELLEKYPGQAVSVTADEAMPLGVAIYPGSSVYEAEFRAKQFSPGIPIVTLNPFDGLMNQGLAPAEEVFLGDLVGMLEALSVDDEEIKVLLQESDPEKDKKNKEKIADLLDKVAANLSDRKFAETFGPSLHSDLPITGGFIVSGPHKNFKYWRVDSQASTSAISKANFDRLVKKGAKPKEEKAEKRVTGAGVVSLPKFSGITMRFVRKGEDGKNEIVECNEPVLIAVDVIGAEQMRKTKTRLIWDPAGGTAEIEKRPEPKKAQKKK